MLIEADKMPETTLEFARIESVTPEKLEQYPRFLEITRSYANKWKSELVQQEKSHHFANALDGAIEPGPSNIQNSKNTARVHKSKLSKSAIKSMKLFQ
jgi:hypothetical protein